MRRAFLSVSRALYSQQTEKKNVFVLPKKHELRVDCLTQTLTFIKSARSCNILAAGLKNNINLFIDLHIFEVYAQIREHQLEIDDSFHTIIVPISLEYIKCFNREQSLVFYQMIMTMLQLKVQNQDLWDAVIQKLDEQNIYRYIPLYQTSLLLNELLDREDLRNHTLTKKLIGVVYQQKNFYMSSYFPRLEVQKILQKMQSYQASDPQLTEAYKQLV